MNLFRRRRLQLLGRSIVSPTGIRWCSILLWLGTVGIGAAMLWASRIDTFNYAVQNARNISLVLERDIQRSIALYDLSLRAVSEGAANRRIMSLSPDLRDQVLFDRAATASYLGTITVRALDGALLADSRSLGTRGPGFEAHPDLDHFPMTGSGLYIGRPLRPAPGIAPVVPLGRVVKAADGSTTATVMGSISIDYFTSLIKGLAIGENGSVTVFQTDGTMIARLPCIPGSTGKNFSHTPVFERLLQQSGDHFIGTPSIDSVQRLYVFKHLDGLPFIVAVAPSTTTIYRDWWRRLAWFSAVILIFTVVETAGAWLFVRELRRRQRAEAALELMARRDFLTGIDNRSTIDGVLAQEWKRARRDGRPMSVLFIDIDCFKAYNDHYGHPAGDDVLRTVATSIAASVRRPGDHVARYGGEEFVAVLPNTDAAGACRVAETIRQAVLALHVEHVKSPFGCLTISVGVSSTEAPDSTDVGALLNAADTALYEAKAAGRNRVVSARR